MPRFFPALALVLAVNLTAFAGPVALFTGTDFSGWRKPTGTWMPVAEVVLDAANGKQFVAKEGAGVMLNSAASKTVDAITELEHGDCELHVEFCVPKGSNSGVYLMGRYEVQIFDSFGKPLEQLAHSDCGGLYERPEKGVGFQGKPPMANASRAPGEWQSYDIVFRAPRFDAAGKKTANAKFVRVTQNGVLIQNEVEVDGPTRSAHYTDEKPLGPLLLQGDHGPVAFRNLSITLPTP